MSTTIKILIAEHDPADLELMHYELKKSGINYISENVQNETDYSNALIHFVPDIILADYTFPSFNGPTAFKIKNELAPDTPFIIVSGTIGEEKSIELIKNGVTDYVLKESILSLTTKVKRALKEAKILQQKKLAEKQKDLDAIKLEQQNNELAKANAELDSFVYTTTHDLRSPLKSILGLTNLIEEESKELHTIDHVKMIRRSINRLDEFIEDILNYAHNNHTQLKVEAIDLQKITEDIMHSLQNIQGAEGINFKVKIDEQQPFYSDIRRVSTVLENLISNAVKYHKQNVTGRYIEVTGKSYKEHLHLCIQDNGIGIAQVHHNEIFNMFFRLPGKVAGSGFGLYIVKETLEKLEGSFKIDSEEGKGTSFMLKMKNFYPIEINDK